VSARPPGRVYLVGAGPGDPDLITLRGAQLLREADAVVFDSLAPPELLALARASALRIDVGKRGHAEPPRSQQETSALLVELAQKGLSVVRLKGGDPFVFGRGGEEASACAAAGVPFEVVPGVSSAVGALAYAGIPITDRRFSASFAVVTGHKDPGEVAAETRWEALAFAADTLVILMGMRNLEALLARLLGAGRSPATPAAAVMDGSLPTQRVVVAPLSELAARVRDAGLGAPAVVVIGEVVRLRETLAWFESRPLFGQRVLVTRSREQAPELASALRRAGAEPVVLPLLEIVPPEDWRELDAVLARQGAYDALLFTSANAVRALAARAAVLGTRVAGLAQRVFCVGPSTAEAARSAGFEVQAVPEDQLDGEGLLALVTQEFPPRGRRFLFPCADQARPTLPEGLRALGAQVDAVTVYRTLPASVDAAGLRERLLRGDFAALTFTSPSAAKYFVALLDEPARVAARRCVVAAIGPVTAEALSKLGLAPDCVADRAAGASLVEALAVCLASRQARKPAARRAPKPAARRAPKPGGVA
jgi:uroporphyrinogen III methyltransferase/synthase